MRQSRGRVAGLAFRRSRLSATRPAAAILRTRPPPGSPIKSRRFHAHSRLSPLFGCAFGAVGLISASTVQLATGTRRRRASADYRARIFAIITPGMHAGSFKARRSSPARSLACAMMAAGCYRHWYVPDRSLPPFGSAALSRPARHVSPRRRVARRALD